jgi:hypothetical protein
MHAAFYTRRKRRKRRFCFSTSRDTFLARKAFSPVAVIDENALALLRLRYGMMDLPALEFEP